MGIRFTHTTAHMDSRLWTSPNWSRQRLEVEEGKQEEQEKREAGKNCLVDNRMFSVTWDDFPTLSVRPLFISAGRSPNGTGHGPLSSPPLRAGYTHILFPVAQPTSSLALLIQLPRFYSILSTDTDIHISQLVSSITLSRLLVLIQTEWKCPTWDELPVCTSQVMPPQDLTLPS
jgi:hypothetical protein